MKADHLQHLLSEWLQQGTDTPIRRAIAWGDHTETHKIGDLVRTPNLVNGLKYLGDDGSEIALVDADKNQLISAISYANDLQNDYGPKRGSGRADVLQYNNENYTDYVEDDYDRNNPTKYDVELAKKNANEREMHRVRLQAVKGNQPNPTATNTADGSTAPPLDSTFTSNRDGESRAVQEQLRNINKSLEKPDTSAYIELRSDDQWHEFRQNYEATASVQGVWFALQDGHVASSPAEKQLLDKAQKFHYATLSAKLKTPKGKGLIQEHFEDMDSKAVWKGLKEHYEGAIMKSAVAKKTLNLLVNERCPETGDFVKHIEDHNVRVRRYDANAAIKLTPEQRYEHLSNFVSNVEGLQDVDDQATMFEAAFGAEVTPEARIQLIQRRALMATSKEATGRVTHRAFATRVDDTTVYSDDQGSLTAIAVDEGPYTAFVTRLRDGSNTRDGTRIPTAVWRLLTDNDKKQWLRISTHGRRTILRSNNPIDDDTEQQDLPSALRDSTRQVNFASTADSTEAHANDRITVGTANLRDSTQDNDTLFINTIVQNAMQSAQKLPPRFHTGQRLHPLDPRSLMSDRHAQTGEETGEQGGQSEGYESYDDERIKDLYYPCEIAPGESETAEG